MPKNRAPKLKPKCKALVNGKQCPRDAVRGTHLCAQCAIANERKSKKTG
jgi:hypothetical protein